MAFVDDIEFTLAAEEGEATFVRDFLLLPVTGGCEVGVVDDERAAPLDAEGFELVAVECCLVVVLVETFPLLDPAAADFVGKVTFSSLTELALHFSPPTDDGAGGAFLLEAVKMESLE